MRTWIVIADSARARLFERADPIGELKELGDYANPAARSKPSAEGRDQPPRVHESASSTRHAIEPHTDAHDKTAQAFASRLADVLDVGRAAHSYTRLVLVAPPRFLGQLRHALDPKVGKLLIETIDKDLSRAKAEQIAEFLRALA